MICKPTEDFKKYAINMEDIDGGNPGQPGNGLWFCGIEPGGPLPGKFEPNKNYVENKNIEINIPYYNEEQRKALANNKKARYDHKVAQLLKRLTEYDGDQDYIEQRLYAKDGDCFKLNLYPLNVTRSGDNEWTDNHREASGFSEKYLYRAWCREHRFPQLRKLMSEYNPRLIICTSKIYWEDFILAFGMLIDGTNLSSEDTHEAADSLVVTAANRSTRLLLARFITRLNTEDLLKVIKRQIQ